ncbi:hypothetical protein [Microbacterium sp. NIBRBAC000506063]|nr:hypothetical protein [Microbacterium sp. NIBRBAC000506063]
MAHYKVPDRFEKVNALPRTSTGKVRKSELRTTAREEMRHVMER